MRETTIIGGVVPGGLEVQEHAVPLWQPPPIDRAPRLPRGFLALLGLGMAGLVLMLAGLVLDALIHAREATDAHAGPGLFTLANPGHLVLLVGGVLAAISLTGATARALSLSQNQLLSSRATATALVTTVLVLAAGTAGAVRWSSTAQPSVATGPLAPARGPDAHGIGLVNSHDPGTCRPTSAQKAAAAKLVTDTELATAKYRNYDAAVADGFVGPQDPTLTEHYSNVANTQDWKVLDPAKPESLLYTPTSHGMVLVAAMYMMNVPGEFGPEPGGCLTRWHVHTNVCFSTSTFAIAGMLDKPGDICGPGTFHWVPPPVLHVWFLDVPGGRFAAEVDAKYLADAVGP